MKHSSNLVVLILFILSSSINITTSHANKTFPFPSTITKPFIDHICNTTAKSTLCQEVLGDQIGKQTHNPVYLLANRALIEAQAIGKSTYKAAISFYSTLIDPKPHVRAEYRRCLVAYNDALEFLDIAARFGRRFNNYKNLKSFVISAGNRVKSCETDNHKKISNFKSIIEATEKFRGLCSITAAISNPNVLDLSLSV